MDRNGPAIQAEGLSKAFGRTPALRELDLEVSWGKVVTVLGPNGSGKTTLIKTLATLIKPDRGTVRVAGLNAARVGGSVRRTIGVVTHDPLLYDDLTGQENLRFHARMFRLGDIDGRINAATEGMGISARLDQRVGTMSHGMKKRFSIARALLHQPAVLLMDEPESGLDQEALAMLDRVVRDHSARGGAVVMTTHNLERAMAVGHRMAILAGGRIAYQESLGAAETQAVKDAYFRYTVAAT